MPTLSLPEGNDPDVVLSSAGRSAAHESIPAPRRPPAVAPSLTTTSTSRAVISVHQRLRSGAFMLMRERAVRTVRAKLALLRSSSLSSWARTREGLLLTAFHLFWPRDWASFGGGTQPSVYVMGH